MNLLTHAAVGLAISRAFPPEYAVVSVVCSISPDLDHLLRWRTIRLRPGGMNRARTVLHELLGSVAFLALGLGLALAVDRTLGSVILAAVFAHLFCDFVNGRTNPFLGIRALPAIEMGSLTVKVVQELALTVGALCFYWLA